MRGTAYEFVGNEYVTVHSYTFADGYKVKLALKNPATGELLQNKGKLWKSKAKLQHKKDGAYSGKFNL